MKETVQFTEGLLPVNNFSIIGTNHRRLVAAVAQTTLVSELGTVLVSPSSFVD